MMTITEKDIWKWLEEVKDPEIPVLSLVDLGVITEVHLMGDEVTIEMTPTFAGCPAIDAMKADVEEVLRQQGLEKVKVNVSFKNPWNSNKITEKGRVALKQFGLAPPPIHNLIVDLDILEHVPCPYCDSKNTELKTPFGPTLCRSMHYCHTCKQAFEQFKPL
jgi:ring-1,2-phenylacetyl-CoA epoxidase subunit PaaD